MSGVVKNSRAFQNISIHSHIAGHKMSVAALSSPRQIRLQSQKADKIQQEQKKNDKNVSRRNQQIINKIIADPRRGPGSVLRGMYHDVNIRGNDSKIVREEQTDEAGVKNDATAADIAHIAGKYIEEQEVEKVFLEFKDSISEDAEESIPKLLLEIDEAVEGSEMVMIEKFILANNASRGGVYILLQYILSDIKKKLKKKKLEEELEELIEKYEAQESGYLSKFFSIRRLAKIRKTNVGAKTIDSISNFVAGNLKIDGIKEVLKFIAETFNNDFECIVSMYMKLIAKELEIFSKTKPNSEDKAKIIGFISTEQHLIMTHNIYCELKQMLQLLKDQIGITNIGGAQYSNLINQVINIADSTFLSDMSIFNIRSTIGFTDQDAKKNFALFKNLYVLIKKLPIQLFKNLQFREKIIADVFRMMQNYMSDDLDVNNNSTTNSSILKKKPHGLQRAKLSYI